jgi:hypothetical protein
MVHRREVLKLGAVSVAGALVGIPGGMVPDADRADSPSPLCGAVFSARFQEGMAFAEEMQGWYVATFSAGYDVARLWFEDLHAGLHQSCGAIAGLTDRVTLFCLEELARSARMRVWYRVDHVIDEHGKAEHSAVGPPSVVEAVRKLGSTSGFGREMAVLASEFEFRAPWDRDALKRTGPFSPENKVALVSWVIA